jgi:exodeoxyribonuclease-5
MSATTAEKQILLSDTQGKALAQFDEWFEKAQWVYCGRRGAVTDSDDVPNAPSVPQIFKIFGFAGSGKTTIAARKAQDLGGGRILAATFTGKAALVMRKKGFNCSTIHSLIYKVQMQPVLDKDGNPTGEETLGFVLNEESDLWNAKLLVVDEVSMVNEELALDLLSFNRPILVLGDPGQLPPVSGTGYFTKGRPDVMLTEIHRQALDSPIIRMSMDIRLGRGVKSGNYGDSKVMLKSAFSRSAESLCQDSDQVLCGLNRTRRGMNARLRAFKGFELVAQPMVGDKLICLRNNREKRLFNGGMWLVVAPPQFDGEVFEMPLQSLDIQGLKVQVKVPLEFFIGEEEKLTPSKRRKFDEFDFGYAITVHKSQGSQWDNVLVYNENYCFRESAIQWLYTAVTRAAERLTLVI